MIKKNMIRHWANLFESEEEKWDKEKWDDFINSFGEMDDKEGKPSNTTKTSVDGDQPFSFDDCYSVMLDSTFRLKKDYPSIYAYVETKEEALRLFDALKPIRQRMGGKLTVMRETADN